jgi:hypothetical protein
MKILNYKRYLLIAALIALTFLIAGCLPSIHKITAILSKVPLGVSRDEIKMNFEKVFKKELLLQLPVEYGAVNINDDKALIGNKNREFRYVYPPNLYDKIPSKAFSDMVGVSESNNGGGSLRIIYDSNTNYIGFFAESSESYK